MTPKERAAMQQALVALEMAVSETLDYIQKNHLCGAENNHWIVQSKKAITALREALANTRSSIRSTSEYSEQEKPIYRKVLREMLDAHEQAEQEQVGYVGGKNCIHCIRSDCGRFGSIHPACDCFFATPVRTKDLTDDEVAKAYMECTGGDIIARFRAVIAADREKNRGTA